MDIKKLLDEFDGSPVDESKYSAYVRFALKLFHDKSIIADPNIEMTLQLDITDAERYYRAGPANERGASLTAYLTWCLIQAIKRYEFFTFREIDGKWYNFKDLPLFFPVAVGLKERFNEILIDKVCRMEWKEFALEYRRKIEEAKAKERPYEPISTELWHISIFIGNLPDLQFTSLKAHSSKDDHGRPFFYFGKRYENGGRLFVPFWVMFDHSTLDPCILSAFLSDYNKILTGQK